MRLRSFLPTTWSRNLTVQKEEYNPFLELQREMNRLFDRFFDESGFLPSRDFGRFYPRIDVRETDKSIEVSAELPGLEQKDVEVSLYDNVLTIKGEKRQEKEEKNATSYCCERYYGSFHRQIALPVEVDAEGVTAKFKNGVLAVTLPKKKAAVSAARKIEIQQ